MLKKKNEHVKEDEKEELFIPPTQKADQNS